MLRFMGSQRVGRTDTMSGQAFLSFAQAVVTMVNRRNKDKDPTKIVEVKN